MKRTRHFNREKITLIILVAVALICRLTWWVYTVKVVENEGAEYARLAENLFTHATWDGLLGQENFAAPPLFPILIGLFGFVVQDLEFAGRFVSLFSGLALVVVLFLFTRRLFSPRTALLSGLLAGMHPVLVGLSVSVFSESLSLLLTVLGMYFALEAMQTQRRRPAALCGLFLGFGYLVRPELLVFAVVASGVCTLWAYAQHHHWLSAVREGVVPFLVAVLVATPYIVYLSLQAGHFLWEGKSPVNEITNVRMRSGMTFWEASHGLEAKVKLEPLYAEGPNLTADHRSFIRASHTRLSDNLRRVIAAAPARAWAAIRKGGRAMYLGMPVVAIFVVIGCATSGWWRDQWGGGLLLVSFGILQGLTLVAVEHHFTRYFLPLVPMFIPWVAVAIDRLSCWGEHMLLERSDGQRRMMAATLAGVCITVALNASAYPSARRVVGELQETRDESVRQAGLWILHETSRDTATQVRPQLMGFSNAVAFYADADHYSLLPYCDSDRALAYVHRKNPEFIVLRSSERDWAPYTQDWLDNGIPDACAVPVFETSTSQGIYLRVWRWKCKL